MALDNYKKLSIEENLANEIKEALKETKNDLNNEASEIIKNLDGDQLATFIEKTFKKNGERLSYVQMKQSPFHTFVTQAMIDLLADKFDKSMDDTLGKSGGIDNRYGKGTDALVRKTQRHLGISVDGNAGKEFFEHAIKKLRGNKTQEPELAQTKEMPENKINEEILSPNNEIGNNEVQNKSKPEDEIDEETMALKKWNEESSSSKLIDIKQLLEGAQNEKFKHLLSLIDNYKYKDFQNEISVKNPDGKLGFGSLSALEKYMENVLKGIIMKPGESWQSNELKEFGKSDWKLTGSFENAGKRYFGSGEWILEGQERKLKKGVYIEGHTLTFEDITVPTYDYQDDMVLRKDISGNINNVSIRYLGDNICINDKYVLSPVGMICSYQEMKYIGSNVTYYQNSLLKPLYDYLNKNKNYYKPKNESIVTNVTGNKPENFSDRGNKDNDIETGKKINEYFPNVEIVDHEATKKDKIYTCKKTNLKISNIGKKGDTLILNNGEILLTSTNKNGKQYVSYDHRQGNHTLNNIDMRQMGYANHDKWKDIYNTLNKKYFQ